MQPYLKSIAAPAGAFIVSSVMSLWILWSFDDAWKYPAEFGFYGFIFRCVIPTLMGLALLMSFSEWRKRTFFLAIFTIAMIVWLYLPLLVTVLSIGCFVTGNCL